MRAGGGASLIGFRVACKSIKDLHLDSLQAVKTWIFSFSGKRALKKKAVLSICWAADLDASKSDSGFLERFYL